MRTAEDEAKDHREIKSEERRAVILLGFLGAFIAFDFWLRDNDPNANPSFNFICNFPCPHITFFWIPFLDRLIFLWFLWAGCMLIYFSEDIFHGWRWERRFRQAFRNLGHGFLILWPTLFAWVLFSFEGDFLIESSVPPWVLTLYWLFAAYWLGHLVVWYIETVTGQKRIIKRFVNLELEGARVIAELGIEGLLPLIERFAGRLLKGRASPRMRRLWLKSKRFLERRRKI